MIERGHGDFVPERIHERRLSRFGPRVQLRSVIEEVLNDRIDAGNGCAMHGCHAVLVLRIHIETERETELGRRKVFRFGLTRLVVPVKRSRRDDDRG